MIAVDTNILVYAHRRDSPFHERANAALTGLAEGTEHWALPWPCVHEFLANVTSPRIYKTPTPPAIARQQATQWLASPSLVLLAELEGYWEVLQDVLDTSKVVGAKIHDARIAALCRAHAIEVLWTADRDFGRFAGLRTHNPLAASSP